eukprot:gene30881-34852_t
MTMVEGESRPAETGEPLVVLEGVNKWFGKLHVLQDINLTIKRGEVVVVIGPSGSGKSTLCRAINRLETIDEGSITLDGQPLPQEGKALANLRAEVGMVFQSFNLFAHKSILENVTLGPIKVRKKSKADAEKRGNELLERVGIGHQAEKGWAILDAGWMAMSRDRGTAKQKHDFGYGQACDLEGRVIEGYVLSGANQEHGILSLADGTAADIVERFPIGTRLRILPNHACATGAQFPEYQALAQDGSLRAWPRLHGW